MKVYRVSMIDAEDAHAGYSFHSSKTNAQRAAAEWKQNAPEHSTTDIDSVEFNCTRTGVLHLLNSVASHPDNG